MQTAPNDFATSCVSSIKYGKVKLYFLENKILIENFNDATLDVFSQLDDFDIISAMKHWQHDTDFVLRHLCEMIINRNLLTIKLKNNPIKKESLEKHITALITKYNITEKEAAYFVFKGQISNQAYQNNHKGINILYKTGKIQDIVSASDQLNLKALSKSVTKYYICYPKEN